MQAIIGMQLFMQMPVTHLFVIRLKLKRSWIDSVCSSLRSHQLILLVSMYFSSWLLDFLLCSSQNRVKIADQMSKNRTYNSRLCINGLYLFTPCVAIYNFTLLS